MKPPPCRCERLAFPHHRDWSCNDYDARGPDIPMRHDDQLSELVRDSLLRVIAAEEAA